MARPSRTVDTCALAADQQPSLNVIGTLARRVPYRRLFPLSAVGADGKLVAADHSILCIITPASSGTAPAARAGTAGRRAVAGESLRVAPATGWDARDHRCSRLVCPKLRTASGPLMGVIISAPGVTVMPSVAFAALCSAGSQTRGSSWTRRLAMGVTIRVDNPRGR